MDSRQEQSPLLRLPPEIIAHIASFLPAQGLAILDQTCRLLHQHVASETLWHGCLREYLPDTELEFTSHGGKFRELFRTHFPYWFIPRFKIWFSDAPYSGRLLIARYSPARKTIEAYALAAERGPSTFEFWDWNPNVILHTFEPRVQLDLNQPVVKLDELSSTWIPLERRWGGEAIMDTQPNLVMRGLKSQLMLTRKLPDAAIGPRTEVWPPTKLPSHGRVRNSSSNQFSGTDHRPTGPLNHAESTFRIRQWMDFHGSRSSLSVHMHVNDSVTTYATLPPEAYTPTPQKPWRGIWCGDYSGHGCEFLVVLQPDNPVELPEGAELGLERRRVVFDASGAPSYEDASEDAASASSSPESTFFHDALSNIDDQDVPEATFDYEHLFENTEDANLTNDIPLFIDAEHECSSRVAATEHGAAASSSSELEPSGQLLGVKLTGDANVPRGEYSFIAPDVGDGGLLRVANEEIFKGARIVKSVGHIAARGYEEDMYIPSQLILVSHDTLAQYWEALNHISFYKRVNIDEFTKVD